MEIEEYKGFFYMLLGYTLKDDLRKIDGENVVVELHNALIQMRTLNVHIVEYNVIVYIL